MFYYFAWQDFLVKLFNTNEIQLFSTILNGCSGDIGLLQSQVGLEAICLSNKTANFFHSSLWKGISVLINSVRRKFHANSSLNFVLPQNWSNGSMQSADTKVSEFPLRVKFQIANDAVIFPFSSNFPLAGLPQKGPIFEREPVEFKDLKKISERATMYVKLGRKVVQPRVHVYR